MTVVTVGSALLGHPTTRTLSWVAYPSCICFYSWKTNQETDDATPQVPSYHPTPDGRDPRNAGGHSAILTYVRIRLRALPAFRIDI